MKVKFTERSKEITKFSELPIVNEIIKYFKEEEDTTGDWYFKTAARVASGCGNMEILKSRAEIARNARAWNKYGDSADFDVWCTVYAFDQMIGFYHIGFYVSDLWELTGDNADEIKNRMYICKYKMR